MSLISDPWFYTSVVFGSISVVLVLALAHMNECCNRQERRIENLKAFMEIKKALADIPPMRYGKPALRLVK